MMADEVKVVITLVEDIYSFEPEKLLVQPGFKVIFVNYTNEEIVLVFPDENLFEDPKISLSAEEGVVELKVKSEAVNPKKEKSKSYPYILYSKDKEKFDKTASLPAIIVVSLIR